MKNYVPYLMHTQLFSGVKEDEIPQVLECLDAHIVKYKAGEYVFRQGEHIKSITLLVDGKLHIQRYDYWGNGNIINIIETGEMFGEAYVTPNSETLINNVIAVEDSTVLFLNSEKIISVCPNSCGFHSVIMRNLIYAISDKNRKLVQKLAYMSNRTTREKLTAYLSDESERQKNSTFTIPFNRQQLADFLSVDRSAMSNELSKMRNEGLIKFNKSKFTLL